MTSDDQRCEDSEGASTGQNSGGARDAPARGRRIAELLASELTARDDGPLAGLELVDVDRDVVPDEVGALAYRVRLSTTPDDDSVDGDDDSDGNRDAGGGDGGDDPDDSRHVADCFVHDDRVRLEFDAGLDRFPAIAADAGLRVRPKAVDPPRALVFVEDTAQVKRVLAVVGSVADDVRATR